MAARLVSLITPIGPAGAARHVQDLAASVKRQRLPAGWTLEWLVQDDGAPPDTGQLLAELDRDGVAKVGRNHPAGPAIARNLALSRSSGSLIKNVDADDVLPDGTLERDIAVLTSHGDVGWCVARVLDLHPDGSTSRWDREPPPGRLATGAVTRYWRAHDWLPPVHGTTLCARRELVLALGGWMSVPGSEDTGLMLALDAIIDGWFIGEPGVLYRQHGGQITRQPRARELRSQRYGLIDERHRTLAALTRRLDASPDTIRATPPLALAARQQNDRAW